jgi:hypothetical protein
VGETANAELEVLTAATMNSAVFWLVTPCSLKETLRFRGSMLFVVIVVDIHTVKTSKNCVHKLYKE